MKTMLITVVLAACTALDGAAMPTKEETEKAAPIVQKLMAPERAALESGKKTRSEVAAAAMKLAGEADTEAAKLLLMKGAFVLYVKDGNLEKAVKTMVALEKAIADLPPQSVTNMVELALLGIPKKEDGVRLYRLLDAANNIERSKSRVAVVDGFASARVGRVAPRPPHSQQRVDSEVDAKHQGIKDRTTVQSIIDGMIKVPGRDFWLSETELTQGQWEAVMGYNLSTHKGANLPVENVSRDDCALFLEKLNETKEVLLSRFDFGLPTLVEWSYAAQAGGSEMDCWIKPGVAGNVLDMAWVAENSSNQTHAVATKAANAFGFYDMLGNVWEWMDCEQDNVGCRHGGSFCDAASDCTVRKGYHTPRNRRIDCYGLRLVAHIRSAVEICPDEK